MGLSATDPVFKFHFAQRGLCSSAQRSDLLTSSIQDSLPYRLTHRALASWGCLGVPAGLFSSLWVSQALVHHSC